MPEYTYTARLQGGATHSGTITATNKAEAIRTLHSRRMIPTTIREAKASGFNMEIKIPGLQSKVKPRDLVIFTRQFAVMVNAGVPIVRALTILKEQSESPLLKKVLESVTADVSGGISLSDALAKHPKAFSPIYINMVRAGEAGGILDKVLNRLAF